MNSTTNAGLATRYAYLAVILLMSVALSGCLQLHMAARYGDTKKIAELLDAGKIDVNAAEIGTGFTPLHHAAELGQLGAVQLLLDRGADVNRKSAIGLTALALAARSNHPDVVRHLIDRGANVEVSVAVLERVSDGKGVKLLERFAARPEPAATLVRARRPFENAAPQRIWSDVDDLPQTRARINKKAYAVVIGIESYRQQIPPADFAAQDARLVTDYLTTVLGYPAENIMMLLNEQATSADLVKSLEKWLSNNVETGSTVFVYFSGHGAPNPTTGDAYLVPYDGDPTYIAETGYSLKRLYDMLGRLPAKEITVVLDSCFSGAGGRSVLAQGARPIVVSVENPVLLSKKITVLSASAANQISSTYSDKGHGLFTYFLLKGIKNENVVKQDGSIDIGSLFDYIKPQVSSVARKKYNNEQTPQLIGAKK